jgi:DNA processing protein
MAPGVDTASQSGRDLGKREDGRGAAFGTGVDVVDPNENSRLSEQLLALGGALISEFPLGTFAAPQNFLIRNQNISGMSVGVLVEAAEYSGTRIAARSALEPNRDVFAVPGNVTNKNSWGPNTLTKQGAKLVATWEDVREDLPAELRLALTPPASPESSDASSASLFPDEGLPPHEKRILSLLKADEAERYGMTSQTRRTSVSIRANLAEGACRSGDVDFAFFLHIADRFGQRIGGSLAPVARP